MKKTGIDLSAHDLKCIRGDRLIFQNLTFDLSKGGALTLIGPNGSGKSSLLRILAGFLKPKSGHVQYNKENIFDILDIYRSEIHYVGHLDAIKPTLTVSEHLNFWATLKGAKKPKRDILEILDLRTLSEIPGKFLSAGQKRRLSLTRLLTTPAQLWILDEPSVSLDAKSIKSLEKMLATHRADGGIVVIATHTEVSLPNSQNISMSNFNPAKPAFGNSEVTSMDDLDNGSW